MTLISQCEYAKRRGISREAVRMAVAGGRISLVDGKIDPDDADVQWALNTRNPKAAFAQNPLMDMQPSDASGQIYNLNLARAKREHHEANMAEMRERQRAGELVELSQVTQAYTVLAAQFRSDLERIPDKISELLAGDADPASVHAILSREIDAALAGMADTARRLPDLITEKSSDA